MSMRTLFSGELWVQQGRFQVESHAREGRTEGSGGRPRASFAGQRNGLCGAAWPGSLLLVTGLRTGSVGLTVERHEGPPAVDAVWEEVVEASFTPASEVTRLVARAGEQVWPLWLEPVPHRVRYCARGMEEARRADTRLRGQPTLDHYLLQFWPVAGAAEPDGVVRQTSGAAARRHGFARRLPAPAGSPRGRLARFRERGVASGLFALDPALCESVGAAGPVAQRGIARWAARRACARAGIAGLDWIAPSLAALESGAALPEPLDDTERTWRLLWDDERVPRTTVRPHDGRAGVISQQAAAIPAVWGAAEADPLRAALEALLAAVATYGVECPALLREVRRAFPVTARPV
ncbi:hypothetical protein ACTWP5_16180 [Streptomyces sp. 4N509B]|uniref:hypothetical protein n=1 Tax=Streptomyces sp. 4N509B TaxID=3457413 RepID=UPI003FD646E7